MPSIRTYTRKTFNEIYRRDHFAVLVWQHVYNSRALVQVIAKPRRPAPRKKMGQSGKEAVGLPSSGLKKGEGGEMHAGINRRPTH